MSFFNIPGLYLLVAPPGSGKTSLIKFEIFKGAQKKSYNLIVIFTSTPSDYDDVINSDYIYTRFSEDALARIMRYQRDNPSCKTLLIFDDMVGAMNFNSDLINQLVTQYRHYNLGVVIATQYCKKIPPTTRESCTKAFILGLNSRDAFKACFESFGQIFQKFNVFQNYVEKNTLNHNFIVIDNKTRDPNLRFTVKRIDINSIPTNTRIEF